MEDLQFIEKNPRTVEKPTLILWEEDDKFLPLSRDRMSRKLTS